MNNRRPIFTFVVGALFVSPGQQFYQQLVPFINSLFIGNSLVVINICWKLVKKNYIPFYNHVNLIIYIIFNEMILFIVRKSAF